jgi:hypothetical protein
LEEVLRVFKISDCKEERKESGVISVLESWEESGYLYICSELCSLGNLNDYLMQLTSSSRRESDLTDEDGPPLL